MSFYIDMLEVLIPFTFNYWRVSSTFWEGSLELIIDFEGIFFLKFFFISLVFYRKCKSGGLFFFFFLNSNLHSLLCFCFANPSIE